MKVEIGSKPVVTVTLSDGTVIVRVTIGDVILHITNRLNGVVNCFKHYNEEMLKLDKQRNMLLDDLREIRTPESNAGEYK